METAGTVHVWGCRGSWQLLAFRVTDPLTACACYVRDVPAISLLGEPGEPARGRFGKVLRTGRGR